MILFPVAGVLTYSLMALFASVAGVMGFASTRKPKLEGEAFLEHELVPRLRHPKRYALRHPVETVARLFR